MSLFFIIFLIKRWPQEEENIYHVMDMYFANFPYTWDLQYNRTEIGFRTSQGCLDLERWLILYEGKIEYMFLDWFTVFYRYEKIENYHINIEKHTFSPSFKFYKNYFLSFKLIPYYLKRMNLWGVGILKNPYGDNYMGVFFRAKHLDNNFSFKDTPSGPSKILYSKFPLGFEIDGKLTKDRSYVEFNVEKYYPSERYIDSPDTFWSTVQKELNLKIRTNLNIKNFDMGGYLNYSLEDTTFFDIDTVQSNYHRFKELYTEPYIDYSIKKVKFGTGITYNYKRILKKDTTYIRYWYSPFIRVIYSPFDFLSIHTGFQKQPFWRDLNSEIREFTQKRLFIGFEFKLKNARFIVYEGIEADKLPPLKKFWFFHNHTYVSLQYTPSLQ